MNRTVQVLSPSWLTAADRHALALPALMWLGAGLLFSIAWFAALFAFPLYKDLPLGYVPIAAGLAAGAAVARWRGPIGRLLAALPPRRFLLVAVAVAAGLRVAAAVWFPLAPANDHEMMYNLAVGLVEGRGYTWPDGNPTAFFPPAVSFLLTAGFVLFSPSFWVAKLLGLVTGTALVVATWWFASANTTPLQARWATAIVCLNPTLVFYSATIGYEPLLGVIVLLFMGILNRTAVDGAPWGRRSTLLGALAGVGSLVKPICLLLPAFVLSAPRIRTRPVRALLQVGLVTVVMLVVILPWTLRNWSVLGSPVLISTNGGPVLYSANNPASEGLYTFVGPLPGEVDEVSRDRIRRRAALEWIAAHPAEWASLAVSKVVYGWGTSSSIMSYVSADRLPRLQEDLAKAAINLAWAPLALWCLAAALGTRVWASPRLAGTLLFLLYLFVVHLFFEALSRHHIPVIPVLAMIAAAWLSTPVAAGPAAGSGRSG